jgi:hypothetical protein
MPAPQRLFGLGLRHLSMLFRFYRFWNEFAKFPLQFDFDRGGKNMILSRYQSFVTQIPLDAPVITAKPWCPVLAAICYLLIKSFATRISWRGFYEHTFTLTFLAARNNTVVSVVAGKICRAPRPVSSDGVDSRKFRAHGPDGSSGMQGE